MPKGLIRQSTQVVKSVAFTLANGAGTTIDDAVINETKSVNIQRAYILYTTATTGTVAAGTLGIGTTVGGVDIVAATAYANAVAVGTVTALVLVKARIPAATAVIVRHTGVAAGPAGVAYAVIEYTVDE